MFKRIIKNNIKKILWFIKNERKIEQWNTDDEWDEYVKYIETLKNVKYNKKKIQLPYNEAKYKYVGAQIINNDLIAIPNGSTNALIYNLISNKTENIEVGTGEFKWTGGMQYKDKIVCFPRTKDDFLLLDVNKKESLRLKADCFNGKEHHYSGIETKEGVVYQPPRNSKYIYKYDLEKRKGKRIYIGPCDERYCGGIFHPNGYIYFFPEHDGKVIKLNPLTDQWKYIGEKISTMVFDAKIATDGNIYGYSAYENGMLKVDVRTNQCKMILEEYNFGAYGTKIGVNGKLYSVPGDGDFVWEYDVNKDTIRKVFSVEDSGRKAKFAGGAIDKKGNIYCVPATNNYLLKYEIENANVTIGNKMWKAYFSDNY